MRATSQYILHHDPMTGTLQVARLMQLAHAVKDANGRAYNRTKYREQRHKMMQHWSDYLDELQANNVVAVKLGGGAA